MTLEDRDDVLCEFLQSVTSHGLATIEIIEDIRARCVSASIPGEWMELVNIYCLLVDPASRREATKRLEVSLSEAHLNISESADRVATAKIILSRLYEFETRWHSIVDVLGSIDHSLLSSRLTLAAQHRLGIGLQYLNRLPEALHCLLRAERLALSLGDMWRSIIIRIDIASNILLSGDTAKAIAMLEEILVEVPPGTKDYIRGLVQVNLATAYQHTNRNDLAIDLYKEVLAYGIPKDLDQSNVRLSVKLNLAVGERSEGNIDAALQLYRDVLDESLSLNLGYYTCRAQIGLALLSFRLADFTQSSHYASMALDLAQTNGYDGVLTEATVILAGIDHEGGRSAQAISTLRSAFESAIAADNANDILIYASELIDLYKQSGDISEALRLHEYCSHIRQNLYKKEAERTMELSRIRARMDVERETFRLRDEERTRLLNTMLPPRIAQRLLSGETRIAERMEGVAVMFADIVQFTAHAARTDPEQLVERLESLFLEFDRIVDKYECEKIKTIGDAYMAICSAPGNMAVVHLTRASLEILDAISKEILPGADLRIGMHVGPVIGGVMLGNRYSYDVWGDTVNVAARMESTSIPGKLHVSETCALVLRGYPEFAIDPCEELSVRGKGNMNTYWISHARTI